MKFLNKASVALLLLTLFICGCSSPPPVGVNRSRIEQTFSQINTSILHSDELSNTSRIVLHRYSMDVNYKKDILKSISTLHEIAENDPRPDIQAALSELCFAAGKRDKGYKTKRGIITPQACYIASSFYSYQYILKNVDNTEEDFFKRELRLACDLYNMSLSAAVLGKDDQFHKDKAKYLLPVGSITITWGHYGLQLPPSSYQSFKAADKYTVRGLSTRNRNAGIGAPILAEIKGSKKPIGNIVPATIFLRIKGDIKTLKEGTHAELELYNTLSQQSISIAEMDVPLETDTTTPIAYTLENPSLWKLGKQMFRLGKMQYPAGIYEASTYDKDKIPVLLVHGTMSSFVWWAEMLNTLSSYPEISNNYQFWLYLYDSAQPLMFSVSHFSDDIDAKLKEFDPENTNEKLKEMVVIGHSQGGLLTRSLVLDTGEIIIKDATGKSIDELGLNKKESDLIRKYGVLTPHPAVKRVVYLCTPHRGSYLANSFARKLASWFITLPQNIASKAGDIRNLLKGNASAKYLKLTHTSIDGMSPNNTALLKLAELPPANNIKQHSIIAIKDDTPPPEGNDGVVEYTSAHIQSVESEMVIRSKHSSQQKPATIEEVRRILLENLKDNQGKKK